MTRVKRNNILLWTVQILLAALFIFAGTMKWILPLDAMRGPVWLPGAFIRFIGCAEIAGGLGLILPGLFRIRRSLTPIAALGLVTIMAGATAITIEGGMLNAAAVPLITGVLAAVIATGRRGWADMRLSGSEHHVSV